MTKLVKIIGCSKDEYWYANRIGHLFELIEEAKHHYIVRAGVPDGSFINKNDGILASNGNQVIKDEYIDSGFGFIETPAKLNGIEFKNINLNQYQISYLGQVLKNSQAPSRAVENKIRSEILDLLNV